MGHEFLGVLLVEAETKGRLWFSGHWCGENEAGHWSISFPFPLVVRLEWLEHHWNCQRKRKEHMTGCTMVIGHNLNLLLANQPPFSMHLASGTKSRGGHISQTS